MKIIITVITLLTISCSSVNNLSESPSVFDSKDAKKYKARITYYSIGEDKWGDKVACPKTHRAKEGITVAAHPEFPFGTEVYIPKLKGVIGDGTFLVQDRGSAVTKKKAAQGKAFVFDVFVRSKSLMRGHAYKRPMYMDVYILQ